MPITPAEHPSFSRFQPWSGTAPAGLNVNFVGQHMNPTFDGGVVPGVAQRSETARHVNTEYPGISEETFEWIAILDAVSQSDGTFRMIELGAGYGRWLVAAACALRQKRPGAALKLIGVEAEPTHFRYLRQHLIENGLAPGDHHLIEAVVNASGDPAHFITGHGEDWYGQAIVPEGFVMQRFPDAKTIQVPAVRLGDLIDGHENIDLVDMDIQGAEQEVVEASIGIMSKKVKRAFVSTHSPEIHAAIGNAFKAAKWQPVAVHGWQGASEPTAFGDISFEDGVQYWRNPRFARSAVANIAHHLLARAFSRFS